MLLRAERLVAVAVPAPLYNAFDYRVGEEMTVLPGMRLRVPFGARQVVGVALAAPRRGLTSAPYYQIRPAPPLPGGRPPTAAPLQIVHPSV
jgi:primosomal protein N' (replication factor Y)